MPRQIVRSLQRTAAIKQAFMQHAETVQSLYIRRRHIKAVCLPVRGFTASCSHKDLHCCVGSFLGYDYSLVYREDNDASFVIVDIELPIQQPLHHFFILPTDLPQTLFTRIMLLHSHHRHVPLANGEGCSPAFLRQYSALARPEHFLATTAITTNTLAHYIEIIKQPYIYELYGQHLYVYAYNGTLPTRRTLDAQVSAASVIANALVAR